MCAFTLSSNTFVSCFSNVTKPSAPAAADAGEVEAIQNVTVGGYVGFYVLLLY